MTTTAPLQGIRVLDFGRFVAGPFCAALLAALGADVIRVERPSGAEDRTLVPVTDDSTGALYLQVGRGKRGMTLHPRRPGGREVLQRLLGTADVVVANLPDAVLTSLGLDENSVAAANPTAVLVTTDAFGPGEWSGMPGFDGVGQVMSGSAHMSGQPGRPVRAAALWVDFCTGAIAALGAVTALYARGRVSAVGDAPVRIRTSLLATALTVMGGALTEEAALGLDRVPSGNRGQTVGPADIVATLDGRVIVQVVGDAQFRRFCELVGQPHMVADPRFADDLARGTHRDVVCEVAAGWCGERTTAEVIAAFHAAGLASAPVLSPRQALEHPHVVSGGLIEEVAVPGMGIPARLVRPPLQLQGLPTPALRRAPSLGEHTEEILRALGYDGAAIARLRAADAV